MTSVDEALSYDRDAVGIGRKGTIDKPFLLKAPFWTVDTLFYAIPKSDIDLEFVHCSFLNVDWKSKDESTGLPSLSKEAINETIALVPSFNEQSQLGEFFNNLDSLITLHQREDLLRCPLRLSVDVGKCVFYCLTVIHFIHAMDIAGKTQLVPFLKHMTC